ncbi:MAG: glutaredoxin 2 [Pontibacterium sp.]
MNLYVYDHCPFCVRAVMAAGYKQVDVNVIALLNDDEATCHNLIGKKMVPILERDGHAMGESLDIAYKLDEIGSSERVFRPVTALKDGVAKVMGEVRQSVWNLLFPRNIQAIECDFGTQGAKDYFRGNKEKMIDQSFEDALAQTDEHKAKVEAALAALPTLPLPSQHEQTLGWDDVFIFPDLRNLTLVKGIKMPAEVRAYVDEVSKLSGVHTYDNIAC